MVRGARSRRRDDGMRKRRRECERERSEKRARMELVSLRGVSYRPPLGSAYHEHEPSALSFSFFLPRAPLRFLAFFNPHDLSHPVFPSKPRRMQTTDASPPANLHLITTITTGDSHETTSGPISIIPFPSSTSAVAPKADTRYCFPYDLIPLFSLSPSLFLWR